MQKRIGDKLYIFDLTPFVITDDTDAEVIFVQNEHMNGYKELNAELAEKIFGFNQFIMCVNKPEWAKEQPTPPGPPVETYTFKLDGNDIQDNVTVRVNGTDIEWSDEQAGYYADGLSDGDAIDVYVLEDASYYTPAGEYNWDSEKNAWTWTVDGADISATIDYEYVEPETYTLSISGTDWRDSVTIKFDGDDVDISEDSQWTVNDNTVIDIYPLNNYEDYQVTGASWDDSEKWEAVVDGDDLSIEINYTEPVAQTYQFKVTGDAITNDWFSNVTLDGVDEDGSHLDNSVEDGYAYNIPAGTVIEFDLDNVPVSDGQGGYTSYWTINGDRFDEAPGYTCTVEQDSSFLHVSYTMGSSDETCATAWITQL